MKTDNMLYALLLAAGATAAPHAQVVQPSGHFETRLIGDGSPRQRYLYEQVTTPVICDTSGGGGCSTGTTETKTSTIGFSAGVDGIPWFNGGFSVSESTSVSETSSCGNNDGAHQVCIWTRIAHTGYESQQWLVETNGMSETIPVGDQGYIWSPNDSEGHANICAYDDECTGKGDQKWGDMSDGDKLWEAVSNKGGPRPYVWGEDRWS